MMVQQVAVVTTSDNADYRGYSLLWRDVRSSRLPFLVIRIISSLLLLLIISIIDLQNLSLLLQQQQQPSTSKNCHYFLVQSFPVVPIIIQRRRQQVSYPKQQSMVSYNILTKIPSTKIISLFLGSYEEKSYRLTTTTTTTTRLYYQQVRTNIELALLDVLSDPDNDNDDDDDGPNRKFIQPLPSDHLPNELSTLNVYGIQITRPIHKMIMEHKSITNDIIPSSQSKQQQQKQLYGHVAYKPLSDTYVGAIGCAATVLLTANPDALMGIPDDVLNDADQQFARDTQQSITTVVCRGAFRFIVKDIIQTIPYTVAIVDELIDDIVPPDQEEDTRTKQQKIANDDEDDEDDDDDDDDDEYVNLSRPELVQRTLRAMKSYVDIQLEKFNTENKDNNKTPLEQSLIEDITGMEAMITAQRQATEEMAAVYDVFTSTALIDDIITPQERYYAIAFMAAEMADFSNDIRRTILKLTDPIERLRIVLQELETIVNKNRATKIAEKVVQTTNNAMADLQVGQPSLPPWTKQIRSGTRIEYYWNEDVGWCSGTVIADPILVVDELLVTVQFDDDNSIHKLPFHPDEKVRWRPTV